MNIVKQEYDENFTELEKNFTDALCAVSDEEDFLVASWIFLNTDLAKKKAIDMVKRYSHVSQEMILELGVIYGIND